jgi:hypothetical protein
MEPFHVHRHLDSFVTAGLPPTSTFEFPPDQGATIAGTHGPGTVAPKAAARAAITAGFVEELHRTNGRIFTNGLLSMMLAIGIDLARTLLIGRTINGVGATP